jgi:copper chaperone NosL
MKRVLFLAVLCSLLIVSAVSASPKSVALPPPQAKCPVCGMFVAKYPNWVASITFKDSSIAYFDGAKDMFTYYLNIKKYNPAKSRADIAAVHVKDYYDLSMIDGQKALYVVGSDVYGPMGKEAVPFRKPADAQEFLRDHKGKKLIRFGEVTPELMKSLE